LIQHIIETLDDTPTCEEAQYLLFGLCTDTGFFRHLTEDSAHVFAAVSRLTAAGAGPNRIHSLIYGNRPLASHRMLSTLLMRTETYFGGRLLLTYETVNDPGQKDGRLRNSDTLYLLLQNTEGVEAVALLQEEKPDELSVGLRSNTSLDVGEIARAFKGGGHKKAAGFPFYGSIDEARTRIIDIFSNLLTTKS
jgi:phosphoesterase RecJ-like protein